MRKRRAEFDKTYKEDCTSEERGKHIKAALQELYHYASSRAHSAIKELEFDILVIGNEPLENQQELYAEAKRDALHESGWYSDRKPPTWDDTTQFANFLQRVGKFSIDVFPKRLTEVVTELLQIERNKSPTLQESPLEKQQEVHRVLTRANSSSVSKHWTEEEELNYLVKHCPDTRIEVISLSLSFSCSRSLC